MDTLVLWFIGFYQRRISKHKGFQCAHTEFFSGVTCSHAVKAIVLERGLIRGFPFIHARFKECRYAYRQLSSARLALTTGLALSSSEDREERENENWPVLASSRAAMVWTLATAYRLAVKPITSVAAGP